MIRLNLILTFALLLLLSPVAFALPTAAPDALEIDALEIYNRNASNLLSRQSTDYTGQIACVPTNQPRICLVRSTQFPTGDAIVTVFDPWCDLMGIRDGRVESIPGKTLSIGIPLWARTVEVTWWIPFWWFKPEGWYWGVHFGGFDDLDLTGTTSIVKPDDCGHPLNGCAYISWLVPFRCPP